MQRRQLLLASPALAAAPRSLHAQPHWLVGTWVGDLVGPRDVTDTRRTLTVTSVNVAAGTAVGQWGRNETPIQVSGNTVRFFTGGNNPVELTYAPPATLSGTVTQSNSGRRPPYAITMQRR